MPGIKKRTAFVVFGICLAVLSALLPITSRASDLKVQESTLYPFRSMIAIQDDFIGPLSGIGWTSTGTTRIITSVANHPGLFQLDSTVAIGTFASLSLQGTGGALLFASDRREALWNVQLVQNDANTTIRIGEMATTSLAPVRGMYFEKLDADTNWFCVLGNASVFTRVDSGVAVDTSYRNFAYTSTGTAVQWSIDQTAVCGTMTTNYPTQTINPSMHIVSSAAAAKLVNVDYFQFRLIGIVR